MTRKMDRFDKAVDRLAVEATQVPWMDALVITTIEAKRLLRSEHAWFRRMVKSHKESSDWPTDRQIGYAQAVEDILTRLTQRRANGNG